MVVSTRQAAGAANLHVKVDTDGQRGGVWELSGG